VDTTRQDLLPVSGLTLRVSHDAILRARWLILGLGLIAALAVEVIEGHRLVDASLVAEVLLLGLTIPGLCWLLLTILARQLAQHSRAVDDLERFRRFTYQLSQYQDWAGLARFITQYPTLHFPVRRAALYLYDHTNARLEYVDDWETAAAGPAPLGPRPLHGQRCAACLAARSRLIHRCDGETAGAGWCLSLVFRGLLVGVLRLELEAGAALTPAQANFLGDLAPEMARAAAITLTLPKQMEHAQEVAQVGERREIAHFLHNALAQQLGFLHLSLDRLSSDGPPRQAELRREELERLRDVAGDAYRQVRNLLEVLRSDEPADLATALPPYLASISRRIQFPIDFQSSGTPRPMPPRLVQHLLGFIREGVHNTYRHAQASRASVSLEWLDRQLTLRIRDDGIGFDPARVAPEGHYGLAMMREDVAQLGGALEIHSTPQAGTELRFQLPL